jgi:hypothetical protein
MEKISELTRILKDNFNWNKARLDCFVRMLLALFAVRTVNLSEIAVGFASSAEKDSRYKRIHRFFSQFSFNYPALAKWIFKLFVGEKKIYLTIDRTNWYWGKTKINIFMLGVAYEGVSIPLLWNLLNKAGNASAQEHIDLVNRFVEIFGVSNIEGVLGDREFASGKFFNWLNKHKIPFYIRIKEDSLACIGKKQICKAKKIFNVKAKRKNAF